MSNKRLIAFLFSFTVSLILFTIICVNQATSTMKKYSEEAYQEGARAARLNITIPCPHDGLYRGAWYEGYMDQKEGIVE